jgi:hypothetical protein
VTPTGKSGSADEPISHLSTAQPKAAGRAVGTSWRWQVEMTSVPLVGADGPFQPVTSVRIIVTGSFPMAELSAVRQQTRRAL